jgi:membrane protein
MTRRAAAPDRSRSWADRGRLFRTLTFWLRPAFVLRVINRFQ